MATWNKLPKDLQKAILTMIILYGSASVSCRLGPVICDPPPPPSVTPMICDPPPPPTTAPKPTATPTVTPMICDPPPPPSVTPMICDPPPPPSGGESEPESQSRLPLAEIRAVDIVWEDGLTFSAETPWPSAHYRWSTSGGTLAKLGERVIWQPPAEPGRYLLQVVADWGHDGWAVDALVLVVEEDGSVTIC